MLQLGRNARAASRALGKLTPEDRTRGLKAIAAAIRAAAPEILAANAEDMEAARAKGLDAAMLDRLALDEALFNTTITVAFPEEAAKPYGKVEE